MIILCVNLVWFRKFMWEYKLRLLVVLGLVILMFVYLWVLGVVGLMGLLLMLLVVGGVVVFNV